MNSQFLRIYNALLFLILLSTLFGQHTELQLQEVSRFSYTSHGGSYTREPIVRYPYVYFPNSYGFQVCIWDSTSDTFTEISNYGVKGSVMEMVTWQDFLYLSVSYGSWCDVQNDFGRLYRVDVSDPYHPTEAGSINGGQLNIKYGNLHIVNNTLLAYSEYDGFLQDLVVINPQTLSVTHTYPGHYHFEIINNNILITRPINVAAFYISSIDPTQGLTSLGEVSLPYATNSFPYFVIIDSTTVATQDDVGVKLWNVSNINQWQQLSSIAQTSTISSVMCNGFLVFYNRESDRNRFYVYDVSNASLPVLQNHCDYPTGLEGDTSVDRLFAYGKFLFHSCFSFGCVCLKVTDNGAVTFSSKCYRFNASSGAGHLFNNYILKPYRYTGIACFNISDINNPVYDFSIFAGNTAELDVMSNLVWIRLFPNDGDNGSESIYNISDIHNPHPLYSIPISPNTGLFFNYDEPTCFYKLDNDSLIVSKHVVSGNQVNYMFSFSIPVRMQTPAFVNNQLYLAAESGISLHDLYMYNGFAENNPQPPIILSDFLPLPGWCYSAGDYLYIRNLGSQIEPCMFYSPVSQFQVNNDIFGFAFQNYVCIGRETGVSFYDTSDNPSGYINEDYYLPQYSYSSHIDWNDNHMFLFCHDNIVVYNYQITSANDAVIQPQTSFLKCYPNPFTSSITIEPTIDSPKQAEIAILNIKGQIIKEFNSITISKVNSNIIWDGTDRYGNKVGNGMYLIQYKSENFKSINKVVFIR